MAVLPQKPRPTLPFLQAVSYTHLDVYKRQVSTGNDALLVGADGEALVLMVRGTPELRWMSVNP